ncbi:MAG TPA: M20/M25/M40 family metallo-hydrolase [Candidatus Acidoferrales bacterium]|nr:M20/M25/M40 family metallo-hydrolase [Candidatus Acidoferrales bacterium]
MKRYFTLLLLGAALTSFISNFSRKADASNAPTDPRIARVLELLRGSVNATTEEQIRITEIPAPPFQESARAVYMKKLFASSGLRVETDEIGNVIGEWSGTSPEIVMLTAHMDTVFPAGTDVHVKREGGRLLAPGISDNGTGLAALVTISKAFRDAKIKTTKTILFVADVGEEGEGNLRGMRALAETYKKRLKYVLALDGSATEYVTTAALASRRVEITITGPGGHSWSDFGAPNPIHALGRGIARFVTARVPEAPRTSFNIGEIEGGTSVNSIPASAHMKVDLRSESETELATLEGLLRDAVKAGVDEEMSAARERGMAGSANLLNLKINVLGVRPAGELAENSPLLAALLAADDQLGNRSRKERSSTDANIPLSMGIPAISLGAGGRSGGAHTLDEWYDPAGRELGLQRVALTVLGVAGLEP